MHLRNATLLLTCLCLSSIGSASLSAQITDITVNNGWTQSSGQPSGYSAITSSNTNPDPRPGVDALGYVNGPDIADKAWDLEAFGYNPSAQTLTYVGGFNPNGVTDSNTGLTYGFGDLFFSTPGNSPALMANQPTLPPSNPVDNPIVPPADYSNPGYTDVIHINSVAGSTLSYSLYRITDQAQLLTVGFQVNQDAGPYALDVAASPDGSVTLLGTGTATISTLTNTQVNSLLNESLFSGSALSDGSADNYDVSFNLSDLNLGAFDVRMTEQCGNDSLAGLVSVTEVPEPRSLALGFLAMAAVAGMAVLRRTQQA